MIQALLRIVLLFGIVGGDDRMINYNNKTFKSISNRNLNTLVIDMCFVKKKVLRLSRA
jgi:hypothetical protein